MSAYFGTGHRCCGTAPTCSRRPWSRGTGRRCAEHRRGSLLSLAAAACRRTGRRCQSRSCSMFHSPTHRGRADRTDGDGVGQFPSLLRGLPSAQTEVTGGQSLPRQAGSTKKHWPLMDLVPAGTGRRRWRRTISVAVARPPIGTHGSHRRTIAAPASGVDKEALAPDESGACGTADGPPHMPAASRLGRAADAVCLS